MRCVVLSAVVVACGVAASAQTVVDSLRLAYTGTVTRYDTLLDAVNGENAVGSASLGGASPNRDLELRFEQTGGSNDQLYVYTAWSLTTGTVRGDGNPSNQNAGFVQLWNPGATSVGSVFSSWDAARTTFSLGVSGSNVLSLGSDPDTYNTRLWNATEYEGQGGTFLDYEFSMTASGFDQAQWDAARGMYLSYSDPTSVAGSFHGVFQNTSVITEYRGYYVFDFSLNLESWAYANRDAIEPTATLPANSYRVSSFGSAIPEPSTYALFLGLGSLAFAGLRCRRKQAA